MATKDRGIAIPLVLLFTLLTSVFLFSMYYTRTGVRKQTLSSHTQKKAHYLAQAGIQHALLKLRLLHREAYKAGAVSRGVCPFFTPYGSRLIVEAGNSKSNEAIEIFRKDLKTENYPFNPALFDWEVPIPQHPDFPWEYEVSSFTANTYYTSTGTADAGMIREVAFMEAIGYAHDPRDSTVDRKELVTKIVELKRKIK